MKKLLKYLFLTLILTFLVACDADNGNGDGSTGDGEEPSGDYAVGYVINNLNDTFQTYILNAAEERAEETGMEIRVENAEEDLIAQQDLVNTLIQNNVDALVVVPVDTSAMGPITDAAQNAGIPLVYVNRNPYAGDEGNMPEGVYYVGSEEIQAGTIQGEYAAEQLDGEGGVAILMGILGNEGAVQRTEGVNNVIDEHSDMEVLAEETAEWQRDQAINIAENWILTYGDNLNAILANNDEMALGAVQAIESTGREDIIVMGVDAIPDAISAISEGRLDGTAFQDAEGQGGTAITILDGLRNGEEPDDQITFIDFQLVDEENVSDFE